jgi:hypothetical protein
MQRALPQPSIRRRTVRERLSASLIVCSALILLLFVLLDVWIFEMRSASMEPIIHARSRTNRGDIVIASSVLGKSCIRTNDLVIVPVTVAGTTVLTVRRVIGISVSEPTPTAAFTSDQRPAKRFNLAAESDDGADSRQLGLFPAKAIRAKVIYVLHRERSY